MRKKGKMKNEIIQLDEDLFKYRYEPDIEGGTLFIYNFKTQKVLRSNIIGFKIIEFIRDKKEMQKIIKDIKREFPDVEKVRIEKDVANFLQQLEKERLIKYEAKRK